MERTNVTEVTSALRREFRSAIEGCIPDLLDLTEEDGLCRDPDEDDRDSIYDYVADQACDTFPCIPHADCAKLAREVTDYFCGGVDADANQGDMFRISDLLIKRKEESGDA